MKRQVLGLLFALCMVFGTGHRAVAAQFQGLGDFSGSVFYSEAADVSADGARVVGASFGSAGIEAFLWDPVSGMQGLGDLSGGAFNSAARAISTDGSIIVGSSRSGSGFEPFIWDATNGMRGLGQLPGKTATVGQDASGDGSIVTGYGYIEATGNEFEAFVWDAGNGMRGLGDLSGGIFHSGAEAISADGSTIVGSSRSGLGPEAFIWDATNGMRGLGDLPGGDFYSVAYDVSGDGSIVVGQSHAATDRYEAFIWDRTNGMRSLGDLPGSSVDSFARGVSADGSVVVGRATSASGSDAFIWDSVNGMRELDQVLIAQGLDLTGWQLVEAYDVSDDGLTVIGVGRNPSNQTEAWYAVIPEPSTGLLVGLCLTALTSLRRRSRKD